MRPVLWRRFDWPLLTLVLLLSGFGILMIASALSGNQVLATWPWRQAGFLAVGLILLFLVAVIDYRLLASLVYPLYLFMLLALVVIAIAGTVSGGARRWLALGDFLLQPSELIKLAVILVMSYYLSTREERMDSLITPIMALLLLAPAIGLIYLQPNLGTALSLVAIGGMILVVSGLRWQHALLLAGLGIAAAIPAWKYLLADYMKTRLLMFLDPATVTAADRYNIDQAMISIGSGGWLGRGLFHGSQSQLHFLRVRHTDFIFSTTAEELGFFGAVVLIILFGLLLLRMVRIASMARDSFGRLIVTGVATMILFQFIVNIGMNLSLMPVTGIPLPFISYGGSSLWTMLIGIGLTESVAMRYRKIEFE
ncbi:MAG: rod shape-determining protein RodA [Chloroflexi bacterium HGW-Chloroflexi-1]|nr:MAG: rod shape-determining protein RodA [Chloroflexi bacterium HGW-Chloroflexi-1]